jgi:hypothetical protein
VAVLILPPGHAETITTRRRISKREKWILTAVLATAAALALIVAVSLTSADRRSAAGCIDVTSAGFIGSQEISGCGAHARAICASVASAGGGYSRAQDQAIAAACRKQGIPVGR